MPTIDNDVAQPKVPRGLRTLGPLGAGSSGAASDFGQELKNEAAAIERWWSQPRWQHTKRVYSGTYSSTTASKTAMLRRAISDGISVVVVVVLQSDRE
jgi:hypothetical protein